MHAIKKLERNCSHGVSGERPVVLRNDFPFLAGLSLSDDCYCRRWFNGRRHDARNGVDAQENGMRR